MEIKIKNYVPFMQEGGEMPPVEQTPMEEPAPEQGGNEMDQLVQAAAQALQTQDCNLAMQVLSALLQALGVGESAAPTAPEGQAPVYRAGGKFVKWVSKD